MSLLTVANLSHSYGTQIVLDGATFTIEAGEKVGLVGRNGCGKTTLMQAVRGKLAPDAGEVQFQRGARVGYLSQDPEFDPTETLRDAAEGAFADLHELHVQMHAIYEEMANLEGEALERLLKKQATIEARIEAAGGYAIDHRIDAMLHGLGFVDAQFGLAVGVLSGGQKGRLGLARLLLEAPDLLLLDEPTNHLDIEGRRWLEVFLADEYSGAVVLVSHDRWLLDRVVDRIIEVEQGAIRDYPGNYAKYRSLRTERQMTQARVHEKQLDHLRRERHFIRKYKTGQRAKQARGRQSRLDRYRDDMVDRPAELSVMRLELPKAPRSGDQVVAAEGVGKSYGERTLFADFDVSVQRGDRVGIIGPNGAGKTTLVRCLLGDLEPDTGEVRLGSRLSVGYYRQLHEHLDMSFTVWQYLQSVIIGLDGQSRASEQQARDLAGAFLFSGGEQDKHLGDISGGERSRAVLAGLVAGSHNLLVLDEPTNHLDIPSAERLEAVLSLDGGYQGTLLIVTHDRALLEATCRSLIILDGRGGARTFEGTYSEWERRSDEATAAPARREPRPARERRPEPLAARPPRKPAKVPNPFDGRTVEELERGIERVEAAIAEVDARLADPVVFNDPRRCRELAEERTELQKQLAPIEREWARRAEESD